MFSLLRVNLSEFQLVIVDVFILCTLLKGTSKSVILEQRLFTMRLRQCSQCDLDTKVDQSDCRKRTIKFRESWLSIIIDLVHGTRHLCMRLRIIVIGYH